ncbi:mucin-5AC [Procambarus clarkii]|uniref:mucin-5AC n=1 Tax=Procambarus clarkii TaxID=6728 RepID=UPI003742CE7B
MATGNSSPELDLYWEVHDSRTPRAEVIRHPNTSRVEVTSGEVTSSAGSSSQPTASTWSSPWSGHSSSRRQSSCLYFSDTSSPPPRVPNNSPAEGGASPTEGEVPLASLIFLGDDDVFTDYSGVTPFPTSVTWAPGAMSSPTGATWAAGVTSPLTGVKPSPSSVTWTSNIMTSPTGVTLTPVGVTPTLVGVTPSPANVTRASTLPGAPSSDSGCQQQNESPNSPKTGPRNGAKGKEGHGNVVRKSCGSGVRCSSPTPSHTSSHTPTPPHTSSHTPTPPHTSSHTPTPPYTSSHTATPPHTSSHTTTPPHTSSHAATPQHTSSHTTTPPHTSPHTTTPKTSSPNPVAGGINRITQASNDAKTRVQSRGNESKSDPSRLSPAAGQGDLAYRGRHTQPYSLRTCSPVCAQNFAKLSKELGETKDQLFALSVQMEEQASHINKLMEENRRYIRENGKLKKTWSGHINGNDSCDERLYSGDGATEIVDRVLALQLQNNELNVCLEREKRRRMEAEARLQRDGSYIKRLEDSVQTLRGTRVVMDPGTYRQVAEAYIAARRTPARRPHTHPGIPGSDLVCDSPQDSQLSSRRLSHPSPLQSSSCPSSPTNGSSPCSSPNFYSSQPSQVYPAEIPVQRNRNGKTKKERVHNPHDLGCGLGVAGSTMNPWDYQQLLESLEDLDGASRGALS